jgi:hypothetical protein
LAWLLAKDGKSARGYHRQAALPVAEVSQSRSRFGSGHWLASVGDRELHGTYVNRAQAQLACEQYFSAEQRTRRRSPR